MTSMIERVAKAIRRRRIDLIGNSPAPMDMIDLDPFNVALARAAIEAMREPTSAMFLVGREYAMSADGDPLMNKDSVRARYTAMIDAALKEQP